MFKMDWRNVIWEAVVTNSGNLRKVDIIATSEWVKKTWLESLQEMIVWSFKQCASVVIDGTEDDNIFEEDGSDDELNMYHIHFDKPMRESNFWKFFQNYDNDLGRKKWLGTFFLMNY